MNTRTKRKWQPIITETKDFAGKIINQDGHNVLKINSPVWYQHQLSKFNDNEEVSLYISSRRPKRTVAQNNYYWGVYLPLIAKETGEHNLERLHKLFSGKHLTKGIVKVLGETVRMVKSTTTLSKPEFAEYIMDIEADTEIQAPPTENYL